MGLAAATCIGIGGMIGAGIFSLMGTASALAGDLTYLSFIIAGVVALFSAYSFAKLGARYPSAGGPVEFLIQGLKNEYIVGTLNLLLWFGYIIVNALYAKAFGNYAVALLGIEANHDLWVNGFAIFVVLLFLAINQMGSGSVGQTEIILVVIKLTILIAFAVGTSFAISRFHFLPKPKQIPSLFYTAGIVFMAYEGFGLITNAAEDMKYVKKNLPRSLLLSIIIVILIYVSVSIAVTGVLSADDIQASKEYALAEAARPIFGNLGFTIVGITALFSTASAINATLYGGANVSYMMAENGELPTNFRTRFWQIARKGLIYTALLVIIIAITLPIEKIAMAGSLAFLVIYGAVNVAHLHLIEETKAKKTPIWIGLIGCISVFCILLFFIIKNALDILYISGGLFLISFIIEYYFSRKRRSMAKRA